MPLHVAASAGHVDVVETLLLHGASIDATTQDGETPLLAAAANGNEQLLRILIDAVATADVASPPRVDAHSADVRADHDSDAFQGKETAASADAPTPSNWRLNVVDSKGNTPVLAAAREGHFGAVRMLLSAGASPNARAADGETLFVSAA